MNQYRLRDGSLDALIDLVYNSARIDKPIDEVKKSVRECLTNVTEEIQ